MTSFQEFNGLSGGDAVRLEGQLPLAWALPPEDPAALQEVMADNHVLLRALLAMDEAAGAAEADHVRDGIQSLERRLDLLLLMASAALRGMGGVPPFFPCALTAHSLRWASAEALGVGQHLWVRIYLRQRVAMPLVLPGVVVEEHVLQDHSHCRTLEFTGLEPAVKRVLERLIFRHHRRDVARQRSSP